jgi:hypothetical protein
MSLYVGAKVKYIGDDSIWLNGASGEVIGRKPDSEKLWAVQWEHMDDGDITYIWEHNLEQEHRLESINDAWGTWQTEDVPEPDYEPIVAEAQRLVYGDRNKDYGHPYEDYVRNATSLTTILKDKLKEDAVITPQDVCLFMIMLKVSRLINDPYKRDSIVDVAGYAEGLSRINRREAGLE